jgi:chorismate mutase/prephenate dehydratase
VKVAIQGREGSFHQQAAEELLGDQVTLLPCHTFAEVFDAVTAGAADLGIAAVENSLHGSINHVYRLLLSEQLRVVGEVFLHIEQQLIAASDRPLSSITRVLSQEPALAQCEQWLAIHLPDAVLEVTHDTADSVRAVLARSDEPLAAVASARAAALYGGHVLAGPINDDPHNYTRFFLISLDSDPVEGANRTSLVLVTNHEPGSLWNALGVFESTGINLSKLDSHPIAGDRRHYRFYVDLEAGVQEERTQRALEQLRGQGCVVDVLGSYVAGAL